MNAVLLLISVMTAGFTTSYSCTPKAQKTNVQGPAITFQTIYYDFGKVRKGNMVTYQYKFTNTGTDKLIITSVHPTCGCTAALASSQEILPGGGGIITAQFNSSDYMGPVTKTIIVATNDPSKPTITLTISGEVVTDLSINPSVLFLGSIKQGGTKEQILNIFMAAPSVQITSVTSSNPYIKVTSVARAISQETLKVAVSPDAAIGPINSEIDVFYTGKNEQVRRVPVIGNIVGDIAVNPALVELGVIKRGMTQPPATLFLDTQPAKVFNITKIQIKPDVLKVHVVKQGKGSYRLELTAKQVKTSGKLNGEITIHTTMKTMPVVTVPFNGVVI